MENQLRKTTKYFAIMGVVQALFFVYTIWASGYYNSFIHPFPLVAVSIPLLGYLFVPFAIAIGLRKQRVWAWYLGYVLCILFLIVGLLISINKPIGVIVFAIVAYISWGLSRDENSMLVYFKSHNKEMQRTS